MMHYIIALNTLQLKRKFALIEPFMGFIQSSKDFYKLGIENLLTNEELDGFCENISASVQNVHTVRRKKKLCGNLTTEAYKPSPKPSSLPPNLTRILYTMYSQFVTRAIGTPPKPLATRCKTCDIVADALLGRISIYVPLSDLVFSSQELAGETNKLSNTAQFLEEQCLPLYYAETPKEMSHINANHSMNQKAGYLNIRFRV